MYRLTIAFLSVMCFAGITQAKPFEVMFPELAAELNPAQLHLLNRMDYKTGTVAVGDNLAILELGEKFYFLDKADANHVLVNLWGNPPTDSTLGMIFPIDASPMHDTWGIEISYDEIGYVSDQEATSYDYSELLEEMKSDTRAESEERAQQGYERIELIGWAEPPLYDAGDHKLYWAKELSFEGDESNTLNYNIRALGRKGVLVINFIADMDQLDAVRAASPDVLKMVSFTPGNRYSDFDPSMDTVAAVGIGGLIAGKVLSKTGLLAVALVFLKKFWFVALIPLLWLKGLIFGRRDGS